MTWGGARHFEGSAGYTLIELLVGIAIFSVIALAGLPHVDTRRESLNTSIQQVLSDMRYARARSITSGEHFAVEWTGANSYEVQRLTEVAGLWQVDSVIRTVDLPSYIQFDLGASATGPTGAAIDRIEFNTRGMMISSNQPLWPVMTDSLRGNAHQLAIWPSGQIYREGIL